MGNCCISVRNRNKLQDIPKSLFVGIWNNKKSLCNKYRYICLDNSVDSRKGFGRIKENNMVFDMIISFIFCREVLRILLTVAIMAISQNAM